MEWDGSDLFQACFGPVWDPIQISWLLGPALHTVHKFGHVAKTGYGAFRIHAQWRPAPEETLTFCLSRCQPEAPPLLIWLLAPVTRGSGRCDDNVFTIALRTQVYGEMSYHKGHSNK